VPPPSFLRVEQFLQFVRKLVDVAEMTIHRREPDVRDFIEALELLHHERADLGGRDFLLGALLEGRPHPVGPRFPGGDAPRPLLAGLQEAGDQLRPLEPFARAVLLHHHVGDLVDPLVAGEALTAAEALAPPPDYFAFLRFARVDDLVAEMRTIGALHGLTRATAAAARRPAAASTHCSGQPARRRPARAAGREPA